MGFCFQPVLKWLKERFLSAFLLMGGAGGSEPYQAFIPPPTWGVGVQVLITGGLNMIILALSLITSRRAEAKWY